MSAYQGDMHTDERSSSVTVSPAWLAGATLLGALAGRDFDAFAACLDDRVRLRALVPRGPFELATPAAVADTFRTWFGDPEEEFALVDASIGQIGTTLHLTWRIRLWPPGSPTHGRTAQQQVFAGGSPRIQTLDLLCSGFHPDPAT